MKRSPGLLIVLVLILVVFSVGCTYQSPTPREVTPVATTAATSAVVVVSTPTPISRETTIATQPTATPTTPFGDLTGSPVPSPVVSPTPGAETQTAATPVPTAAPTSETAEVPAGTEGVIYTVRWGDTLFSIAQMYGTTVDAIKAANGLTSDFIIVGQELIIPVDAEPMPPEPMPPEPMPPSPGGQTIHIVQPGENLYRISLHYGTTVEAIARANDIMNPWFIYVGQKLVIPTGGGGMPPSPGPGGNTYVVQPGDTLYSIAVRFDTTVEALMVANNLSNPHLIYVGQTLIVP